MVELVDSLDSGSSVHCGRAGSSPASPTKEIHASVSLFSFCKFFPLAKNPVDIFVFSMYNKWAVNASVAQLVVHLTRNEKVACSSQVTSSTKTP